MSAGPLRKLLDLLGDTRPLAPLPSVKPIDVMPVEYPWQVELQTRHDGLWSMTFKVDRDDAGGYPVSLAFEHNGFHALEADVPSWVYDELVKRAYARIRGDVS